MTLSPLHQDALWAMGLDPSHEIPGPSMRWAVATGHLAQYVGDARAISHVTRLVRMHPEALVVAVVNRGYLSVEDALYRLDDLSRVARDIPELSRVLESHAFSLAIGEVLARSGAVQSAPRAPDARVAR